VLISHKPFTKRRLSLHKCWPPHSHSDINPQHEQKHLLHNRSNCRYRNRAQIARPFLGVGPGGVIATANIFVADAHRDDGKRFIVSADEKLTVFLELEVSHSSLSKQVFPQQDLSLPASRIFMRDEGRCRPHDCCATESGGH
jgi:hypothetical protein